ncbi:MAG: nucleoside transporter C-terminal domain-containing protein [Pirellulales bacterium]|nr:nucleoside transporter C-terminal domain-containing protein [Pirellulales bacterium]
MERLISGVGLLAMIGFAYLLSSNRKAFPFRVVVGGLILQILFALLILWTPPGKAVFQAVGGVFTNMISYVDDGSRFMFGMQRESQVPISISGESKHQTLSLWEHEDQDRLRHLVETLKNQKGQVTVSVGAVDKKIDLNATNWETQLRQWFLSTIASFRSDGFPRTKQLLSSFAFGVLPTIIFFSSLMSMLYYLGIMQKIVSLFAWIMQRTLGTSGAETLSAAANVFVGQTEAPLVIRPYVSKMTQSELMAVMVGGFATIAGGVLAAYVSFGIDAGHLITASVISAPAALLIAKVMQPETEHSVTMGKVELHVQDKESNLIEAAASGATAGMKLAINVAAMLIAFLAIIAMVNGLIGWTGTWFGFEEAHRWTLEKGLGWLFWPLAYLMGIPAADCGAAGQLLGTKMVANEFVAYLQLGELMEAGQQTFSPRTVTILTYALCGFANFGSIGIQLGGIGGVAPDRRGDLARLGLRAMIGGTLAAFMTACIAGILI